MRGGRGGPIWVRLARSNLQHVSGCPSMVVPGSNGERRIPINYEGSESPVFGCKHSIELAMAESSVSSVSGEVDEKEAETHILLVVFSSQGHFNPVLEFGRRLASIGLRPTVATNDLGRQEISSLPSSISLSVFSDGLPKTFDRWKDLPTFFESLRRHGTAHLSNLLTSSPHRFSLVVTSPFLPWAADVAQRHDIPCALLWIQPITVFSILYHRFNDPFGFPTTYPIHLPGLPPLYQNEIPSVAAAKPTNVCDIAIAGVFRELFSESLKTTKWVLANSFKELEESAISALAAEGRLVVPVGPLVPAACHMEVDMREADDSCEVWLDEQPEGSVVYVSFGSLMLPSSAQVGRVARAAAGGGRRFLWVANGYEVEADGEGKVVAWCAQPRVLRHRAIGCFVSHCGWNSTLEAVVAGVPVVGMPRWGDQVTNARLVEEWGIGVRLTPDEEVEGEAWMVVSEEKLRWGIEKAMENVDVRSKAKELAERARRAAEHAGDLRCILEDAGFAMKKGG